MSVRNQENQQSEVALAVQAMQIAGAGGDSDPDAPQSAPTLSADIPPVTRTILVSIRASLAELTQEATSARWAPTGGSLKSIFQQR